MTHLLTRCLLAGAFLALPFSACSDDEGSTLGGGGDAGDSADTTSADTMNADTGSGEAADTSTGDDASPEPFDTSVEPGDTNSEPGDTSVEPEDTTPDPIDSTVTPEDTTPAVTPTWDEVDAILFGNCASCHYGQPAGLAFADAYNNIVNVESTEAPGMMRVAPGDPDNSYLWRKVEGTHLEVGSGDQMPQRGSLSDADKATIHDWIAGGAPN